MINNKVKNTFFVLSLLFAAGYLIGCAPEHKIVRDKVDKTKTVETYRKDIDKDGKAELVILEDKSASGEATVITVAKGDKAQTKIDSLTVEGVFKRVRFADLNGDGVLALAVFSITPNGAYRLIIYKLNEDGLLRIFSIASKCGIDADFSSPLSRIRVVKPNHIGEIESCDGSPELETWVWSGDRYIRG